ncbi:MAG: UDP-N-acetylmuramoyl-L-alanyl-D-glutamate--2,6-diaminopimelate ligase [Eubacteriales bacterium]|nr:UDP-N-acetylmuramoyl-L-alanyl-D-glutamate--2,6-diaminopimelate ligase [Eubacteriales bacterium]
MMKLSDLLKNLELKKPLSKDVDVNNVTIDSRKVGEGDLYICLCGVTSDGHNFAPQAEQSGASAIICEREVEGVTIPQVVVESSRSAMSIIASNFYGNPSNKMSVIGVTGTNGKTTVTHLIKEILDRAGHKTGLIGTANNIIGDKLYEAKMTTPDPLDLHKLYADMVDAGCDTVIMEVSSHSLYFDKLYGVGFTVGAFTNLTQDHLDFHKTMDAYFEAKCKLFDMSKNVVINGDDPYGRSIAHKIDCISYGCKGDYDIMAENTVFSAEGVKFDLKYKGQMHHISLAIPGEFSVYNALTAFGCCVAAGLEASKAAEGLCNAVGVKGRVEVVPTGKDFTILIDYAHTPDALENVLKTVRGFAKGRVVAVFGCGGDRDRTKRPIMGRIATECADVCIVTSDNPRTEDPDAIIQDIIEGMKGSEEKTVAITSREDAIAYAIAHAKPDDVIVLAGKGHETYQIFKDKTIHFDEREVVRKYLPL